MKRYIFIALLALTVLPSTARENRKASSPYRHEVNVSWGWNVDEISWRLYDFSASGNNGMDYIYNNYIGSKKTTGLISADYNIQLKRWFALGAQVNAVAIQMTEMSSITESKVSDFTDYAVTLLPYARFTYLNREYLKLYSSVGLGLGLYHDETPKDIEYTPEKRNSMGLCAQFVPFGIMVGKKVYAMAELGTGTEYVGFRAGLGFRF